MVVNEHYLLTLEIITNQNLSVIGPYPIFSTGIISIEKTSKNNQRRIIEDTVRLYSFMRAEATGDSGALQISPTVSNTLRTISPTRPATWTWNIQPRKAGDHSIVITILGEIPMGDQIGVDVAAVKDINVFVANTSWYKRFWESFISALPLVLSTSGPLALWLSYLTYKASEQDKKLMKQTAALEVKLAALEQQITHPHMTQSAHQSSNVSAQPSNHP